LALALRALKAPIFVSYTRSPEVVDERQSAFLDQFVPADLRASADFLRDPIDGAVRWINPGGDGSNPLDPRGLASLLATQLGHPPLTEQREIAWRPRPDRDTRPFPVYPANTIDDLPADWLRGRVVLIGGIVSLEDRHRTPLSFSSNPEDRLMPGVLIHAHTLAQLLEEKRLNTVSQPAAWLTTLALALIGYMISIQRAGLLVSVAAALLVLLVFWLAALFGYRAGAPLIPLVTPSLAMGLGLWFSDLTLGRAERRRRRFLQTAFSRYVSPVVVNQLIERPDRLRVECERRDATFLFTDIAGFTALAERLAPEALSKLLNEYLDGCCQIIFAHQGTIDKFIGDSVMAVFNAPLDQPDHARRALRCAIAIDQWTEGFRLKQAQSGLQIGATRIGVHTGAAMVGNFGSQMRMEFTALGDTVNVASRVEGVNRIFGTRLICTEPVARANPDITLLELGAVQLTGREAAMRLFTVASTAQQDSGFSRAWANLWTGASASERFAGRRSDSELPGPTGKPRSSLLAELARNYPEEPLVRVFDQSVRSEQMKDAVWADSTVMPQDGSRP
jgi:adenylate cyclase